MHALRNRNFTHLLGGSELSVLWCPVDRTSGVWLIALHLFGPNVLVIASRTEKGDSSEVRGLLWPAGVWGKGEG